MNGYYSQLVKILTANGYVFLRNGKGSHEIWTNGSRNQVLPFNCPSPHTANAILKQCGLPKQF